MARRHGRPAARFDSSCRRNDSCREQGSHGRVRRVLFEWSRGSRCRRSGRCATALCAMIGPMRAHRSAARPGRRLWIANAESGNVQRTLKLGPALLACGHTTRGGWCMPVQSVPACIGAFLAAQSTHSTLPQASKNSSPLHLGSYCACLDLGVARCVACLMPPAVGHALIQRARPGAQRFRVCGSGAGCSERHGRHMVARTASTGCMHCSTAAGPATRRCVCVGGRGQRWWWQWRWRRRGDRGIIGSPGRRGRRRDASIRRCKTVARSHAAGPSACCEARVGRQLVNALLACLRRLHPRALHPWRASHLRGSCSAPRLHASWCVQPGWRRLASAPWSCARWAYDWPFQAHVSSLRREHVRLYRMRGWWATMMRLWPQRAPRGLALSLPKALHRCWCKRWCRLPALAPIPILRQRCICRQ